MSGHSQNDDALRELLSFIDGSSGHGVGIRSYITDDPRQKLIHEGCLELERRGKIERHFEDGDMVLWMPREEGKRVGFINKADASTDILVYETSRPVNYPRGQAYETGSEFQPVTGEKPEPEPTVAKIYPMLDCFLVGSDWPFGKEEVDTAEWQGPITPEE